MPLKVNGKEINHPAAKAAILIAVGIILVLVATIVIPILGVALGIALLALGIAIPLLGWKKIVGKVTSKINIDGKDHGDIQIESNLFETMSTNKELKIISKDSDLSFNGTDNYNKLSIECDEISYTETLDEIKVYIGCDAKITLPKGMRISAMTGVGDIKASNIRRINVATGSGDVKVTNLLESIKGATGAGDFKIIFIKNAIRGEVDLATASGDALITLPADSTVSYQAASISGSTECELPQNDRAPFKVKFAAASGDLSIVKWS